MRLNTDGTRDISFVRDSFNLGVVYKLVIQNNGKILVGTPGQGFIRLNSNGSTDTSFSVGNGFNGNINTLSLQSDGRILVGGSSTTYNGIPAK